MPPRPPLTTLALHTWKEHGKPRPLSNHDSSEKSNRKRISQSISQDSYLDALLHPERSLSTKPLNRPGVIRSVSVEDSLLRQQVFRQVEGLKVVTEEEEDDVLNGLCVRKDQVQKNSSKNRSRSAEGRVVTKALPPKPRHEKSSKSRSKTKAKPLMSCRAASVRTFQAATRAH